jgi:hypothetical protein
MKQKNWIYFLISIVLIALMALSVSSISAAPDALNLHAPTACPSGGCAAGQRLNFLLEFSITPNTTQNPNTQICVFAPIDGQAGEATGPWANSTDGWISDTGLITGFSYTPGQRDDICTSNTQAQEALIFNAYATHLVAADDQLEFSLNIDPSANLDGYLRVKIFQALENGNWDPSFTTLEKPIPVAEVSDLAYIAVSASECENNSPCFINSGEDLPDGRGTGLRDAILALDPDSEIRILKDYTIKDHSVLVDKNLTILGQDQASISYSGANCSEPMLSIIEGGTIQNLIINDGNCASPSRNLLQINSDADVHIQNNTLQFGNQAVRVEDNQGDVTIAFNHIEDNQDYAIYRKSGTGDGQLNIFANNIFNNRSGAQVDCKNLGNADHNFWGSTQQASENAANCAVNNAKQLGAPILEPENEAGVEAILVTVTGSKTYYFDNQIAVWHSEGADFDLIIVNHGQGTQTNIPFLQSGAGEITPCSNFYDLFLQQDASASNLLLSLKYDLNNNCINTIESSNYCSQADSAKFPLWWYDPSGAITDGWDTTGQNPAGSGAAGAVGQETSCNLANKEIMVTLDNTGRPNLTDDLNFTPFVIGLPINVGIDLAQFTALYNVSKIDLQWVTNSENDIQGFYVQRADSQSGPYSRISQMIDAVGNSQTGGTYNYSDAAVTSNQTYYYKIEVVNNQDESIETHGPISILAVTPTPTLTATGTGTTTITTTITNTPTIASTSFPTRTATRYFVRTRTRVPGFITATPQGPTQVRTYGPTPTGSLTIIPNQTRTPGSETEIDPNTGYPITGNTPQASELLNEPPSEESAYPISTPNPQEEILTVAEVPQEGEDPSDSPETTLAEQDTTNTSPQFRWYYILIGAAAGGVMLLLASLILTKIRFI